MNFNFAEIKLIGLLMIPATIPQKTWISALIFSIPEPDFINPENEKCLIDKYISTHRNDEIISYLNDRKDDYITFLSEIYLIQRFKIYKDDGENVTQERRLLLTYISCRFNPREKKKIDKFLDDTVYGVREVLLLAVTNLIERFNRPGTVNPSAKNKYLHIRYLGPREERDRLFKALYKNGYIGKYSVETLDYRVRCINTKDKYIDDEHEYPMFIWLKDNKDLACLVKYLEQKNRIKHAKKCEEFKHNFTDEDGTIFNNISQDLYNAGKNKKDYDNPELKKLVDDNIS